MLFSCCRVSLTNKFIPDFCVDLSPSSKIKEVWEKYFRDRYSGNLSAIIVKKCLHRESVKGKTERIVTDSCSTCIPMAIFCVPLVEVNHVPRINHAKSMNLGQKINGTGVYPDGIRIRIGRKRNQLPPQTQDRPCQYLTIQVKTPKTLALEIKMGMKYCEEMLLHSKLLSS